MKQKPRREAEVKSLNRLSIIRVDAIPPSVNTYVRHSRSGGHYIDPKAASFKSLLALACRGVKAVYGRKFEVEIGITLGKGQKGDVDNFPKLVLDTLARADMMRDAKSLNALSDSHVTRLEITKGRGESPRTTVTLIGVA